MMKRDEYIKTSKRAKGSQYAADEDQERATSRRNSGLVKLLLSCPVKGWFEPLERTAITEHIEVPTSE